MGRVKTTAVKNLARDLLEEHGKKFTADFEKNKKIIDEVRPIKSKKIRNIVAGYIAKVMKRIEKTEK